MQQKSISLRISRLIRNSPKSIFPSARWHCENAIHEIRCKLLFGILNWAPKQNRISFLAYCPDSVPRLPDMSALYTRWISGNKINNNGDGTRFLSLILNLRQLIRDETKGDFAELGVWKGNSAAILAKFAAENDRKLILFDTFSGFDGRDLIEVDANHNLAFGNTSVDQVKRNVEYADTVQYRIGYFPETLTESDKNSRFAFVHLDCDLYGPMKSALEFFYARMSIGAMMVVHDYSSGTWSGATKALDEFTKATGEHLVLWPDKSGTAMFRKAMSTNNLSP